MWEMKANPEAIDRWVMAARRFAGYRGEIVEVLRWMGEQAVEIMKEGHPPGGPHPPPGEQPVYGQDAYIDRSGWLTGSIGFSIEPWIESVNFSSALPTLLIFATAPYADAVEFGIPGRARPYPFFWPTIITLMGEATARIAVIMERADGMGEQ